MPHQSFYFIVSTFDPSNKYSEIIVAHNLQATPASGHNEVGLPDTTVAVIIPWA